MYDSMRFKKARRFGVIALAFSMIAGRLSGEAVYEMTPFNVTALASANTEPSTNYASLVTHLRYAPEVDLQTRGFPEGQSDVTVRGSTFEQTGFVIGGIALYDPQTGHYSAEVPFDPEMLSGPSLLLGAENGLSGFNSNVATIAYDWAQIEDRGRLALGVGSDALNYQSLYQGVTLGSGWAVDVSAGRSEGDGTVDYGDFKMERYAGRLQYYSDDGLRIDVFAGYQDKFYGWPELYIGGAYAPTRFFETDDYQNLMAGFTVSQDYGDESYVRVGGLYRELVDDYEYDRTKPQGEFRHRTAVFSGAIDGRHYLRTGLGVDYALKVLSDDLVRSTKLTNGDTGTGNDFTKRDYLKVGVTPRVEWTAGDGSQWTLLVGGSVDASSEDKGSFNPMFRLERVVVSENGSFRVFGDYSETSQVAGYTALRSSPSVGLFRGNPNLEREVTQTGELGFDLEQGAWMMTGSVFYRKDDGLTDWVYSSASTSARSASPVDLETLGGQFRVGYTTEQVAIRLGYTGLTKDSDYGTTAMDASYYALNYARHMVDLSAGWTVVDGVELVMDLEYRHQFENALRMNGDNGFLASVSAWWSPEIIEGLTLGVLVDNLTDDNFQEFPGTLAPGRRYSFRLEYRW